MWRAHTTLASSRKPDSTTALQPRDIPLPETPPARRHTNTVDGPCDPKCQAGPFSLSFHTQPMPCGVAVPPFLNDSTPHHPPARYDEYYRPNNTAEVP